MSSRRPDFLNLQSFFKPAKFDAGEWVDIAEKAGMKFIVVTAKHHDGFAMYHSANPYNLVDFAGFGRDILKELSVECARRKMNLGFYYSQSQDWHEEGGFGNNWDFSDKTQKKFDDYFAKKAVPQVEELTKDYGDIFMVWFDTPVQMDDGRTNPARWLIRDWGRGMATSMCLLIMGKPPVSAPRPGCRI
jgi:alpha-L-fucosidase